MNKGETALPYQPCGQDDLPTMDARSGMTLRDCFAAHAISGVLVAYNGLASHLVAEKAYDIADAMLKKRKE